MMMIMMMTMTMVTLIVLEAQWIEHYNLILIMKANEMHYFSKFI